MGKRFTTIFLGSALTRVGRHELLTLRGTPHQPLTLLKLIIQKPDV